MNGCAPSRGSIVALACLLMCVQPSLASAQAIFNDDPVDPFTQQPYPMMPGLPLVLPGPDEKFGTSDDVVDTGLLGDVDLVVRVGDITSAAVPPPAGAVGGAPVQSIVAGGEATGVGGVVPFTVMASDGSGSPPYGNVLTSTDLDLRPLLVLGFADLDGDGIVGRNLADGAGDETFELQEALAYVGRQVGSFTSGRLQATVGTQVAAPASMGGLDVVLVAAGYAGQDPDALFSDGPAIYTLMPHFPPLDPARVIGNGNVPPPDPGEPSEFKFDIERLYVPAANDSVLATAFSIPTDGSEPTTDHVRVESGAASSAAFFVAVDAASFRPTSRMRLRPAPAPDGTGRALVLALDRVALDSTGVQASRTLRLLPVDLLGNVADPEGTGLAATLSAGPGVRIDSPDTDGDPGHETVAMASAAGVEITLSGELPGASWIDLTQGSRILGSLRIVVSQPGGAAGVDSDADQSADDGSASGAAGDLPCMESDANAGIACDDNCAGIINPTQLDDDRNGVGDCCDGLCLVTSNPACNECAVAVPLPISGGGTSGNPGSFTRASLRLVTGKPGKPDKLTVRAILEPAAGATLAPDSELVILTIADEAATRYTGSLAGLLAPVRNRFLYKDPDASIDGIRSVKLQQRRTGDYKITWRAKGVDLLELPLPGTDVQLRIGDDTFESAVACTSTVRKIRCQL